MRIEARYMTKASKSSVIDVRDNPATCHAHQLLLMYFHVICVKT